MADDADACVGADDDCDGASCDGCDSQHSGIYKRGMRKGGTYNAQLTVFQSTSCLPFQLHLFPHIVMVG